MGEGGTDMVLKPPDLGDSCNFPKIHDGFLESCVNLPNLEVSGPCLRGFPKSAKSTQISCVGVTETKGGMVVKESKKFANVICTVHAPLGKKLS